MALNIFQRCHDKNNINDNIKLSIEKIKNNNPEFNYYLFDNNGCINFLKNNFNNDVLHAYNKLKPESYKSDLWKYCILYIYGGVFIDITKKPINNFKFIDIINNNQMFFSRNNDLSLLISYPKNPIFITCIEKIIENVNNNYYGVDETYPTNIGLFISICKSDNIINDSEILQDCEEYENIPAYLLWKYKKIYN